MLLRVLPLFNLLAVAAVLVREADVHALPAALLGAGPDHDPTAMSKVTD